eukprot:6404432-Pyramimonas_sp.AAC.1
MDVFRPNVEGCVDAWLVCFICVGGGCWIVRMVVVGWLFVVGRCASHRRAVIGVLLTAAR